MREKGQSLIELLLAMGLLAVFLPALTAGFVAARESKPQKENRMRATALLVEAEEAVRVIREAGWAAIAADGLYHPEISGATWVLVSGSEPIDTLFTRQIEISAVQRDADGAIVSSGGTIDTSTKKVEVTVSWLVPIPGSVSSIAYYTRFVENTIQSQTTQEEFDWGTYTNTESTNDFGGEVKLEYYQSEDWADPQYIDVYDNEGNGNGVDVFVDDNYAYLATNNTGTDPELTILDVVDPANVTEVGTLDLGDHVYEVHVQEDYAYLATGLNSQEFVVVDVSNKSSPNVVASLDLGSNRNAFAIYVDGDYAYVGKDSQRNSRELYIIDISIPTSPVEVGSYEESGDVEAIYVSGDYAYLATKSNNRELDVVNISNKSLPYRVGSYDTPGNANARCVYVVGDTTYLGTDPNTSGAGYEFYIFDTSNLGAISLLGGIDAAEEVWGIWVEDNLAHLATDRSGYEYAILDVSNSYNPRLHGYYPAGNKGRDVFVDGNYAYVANQGNNKELQVFEGGDGSFMYRTFGMYECPSFDAGAEVAFNFLDFTISEQGTTDVNFQVAINNDDSTWNYVGPDGTSDTYYENAGAIHLELINGRYFKYRAYFSGDSTETPVLEDISISYSP